MGLDPSQDEISCEQRSAFICPGVKGPFERSVRTGGAGPGKGRDMRNQKALSV